MATSAAPGVRDTPLSAAQDALLHSLERQLQLRMQAETNASLMQQQLRQKQPVERPSGSASAATVKELLAQRQASSVSLKAEIHLAPTFLRLADRMAACSTQWDALSAHAHASQALVAEMEASHVQVAAKTQALYRSFEDVLQQVEALDARVAAIAAPMPHFTAVDSVAHALGFGVKFAAPSSSSSTGAHVRMERTGSSATATAPSTTADGQKAVQVFQHRRGIDPTTAAFEQALEKIDESVGYLSDHVRAS
ncbi:hypothetical protein BBJ28_00020800 [Nothophytophthora sp. Chile5]|nr:hypothetical protein BBJ28_00020800 [Nothophytophthora sp. Chile5]